MSDQPDAEWVVRVTVEVTPLHSHIEGEPLGARSLFSYTSSPYFCKGERRDAAEFALGILGVVREEWGHMQLDLPLREV